MADNRDNWTCSICGHHSTLHDADRHRVSVDLWADTSVGEDDEGFVVFPALVRCPNKKCRQQHLAVSAVYGKTGENSSGRTSVIPDYSRRVGIGRFTFLPTTTAPLSGDVPAGVQADYREAHLICELSPKASATLARRALQGMIRDYWGVSKNTLANELKEIETKCDADVYQAMMAVKSVGNIGAHPERDISVIIDIEPGEAKQLLDLVHLLDQEWYVARAHKRARLASMTALGQVKSAEQKQAGSAPAAAAPSAPKI
ncbi:DUF4145 domain-containing protein [Pelomonas sp. Root1237]|uniref:DUF4145 domain-containing protein n=1 Tax=Pelomonas sp. Root1237 TaxID=1736434 RepID=UPI0009EAC629|nr:DUF4145 domain-containing protein [Pelomonas sp. Root1237]